MPHNASAGFDTTAAVGMPFVSAVSAVDECVHVGQCGHSDEHDSAVPMPLLKRHHEGKEPTGGTEQSMISNTCP